MTTYNQHRSSEPPLLKTKITAPFISTEYVHRPRLTERIDRGVKGPLTLLAAPAGYGKTNLLVEWTKKTDLPTAWLNVDTDDNDIFLFFRYLISAFQTLDPQLGEESIDFIQPAGGGLEIGLTLLINEISTLNHEIVFVLDDFQVLHEVSILKGINFLLKNIPSNLHFIISSRTEPPLELASFRAKGKILEIGMEDLRFSGTEVENFLCQSMDLHLPPETVKELETRTDGWITGLQMAAISMRNRADPKTFLSNFQGDAHYLVDFLAEEVLDRQPEEVRQFLLRSSILDELSGSLCEAVVNPEAQPGYGTVILNQLEHAKLFITALDEKQEWYRYHHLFTNFLRHIQSEINPGEIPELQKRAALWFEQHGSLDKAFQYALESGDVEWTVNLIDRNIERIVKSGEIFPLTRWIAKLPKLTIHQRPRLSLTYAWGSIAAYNLDDARYWIDDVQKMLDQYDQEFIQEDDGLNKHEDKGAEESWNIRGGLAICQSTLALLSGDTIKAAEFSKQAVVYLGEENPFIHSLITLDNSLYYVMSGDTRKAIESLNESIKIARHSNNLLVLIIATCQLADMQALQGKMNRSWVTLQKAQYMTLGPEEKPLPLSCLVDVGFGEILLERNLLSEASIYLERGVAASGSWLWLGNLGGMASLARLRQAQGDLVGSQTILSELSQTAMNTESNQWDDSLVSAIAVRLALQRNDLDDAEQWWQKGSFPELLSEIQLGAYPYHVYEYLVLTQIELITALGKNKRNNSYLQRSVELLESLHLEAIRCERVTTQIEITILQSIVQMALGDLQQSKKTLINALAMGEPEGYFRIFLDGGPAIAEILTHCRVELNDSNSVFPSSAYVEKLLTSFQNENKNQSFSDVGHKINREPAVTITDEGMSIFLSAREIEVINLIAEGKSNQEISAQLFLALNTVKRHAYNIYAKLGVKNRTQAVSKARKLNIIS